MYIATNVAHHMDFQNEELLDLFHAAALHDIGLIRNENKLRTLQVDQLEEVSWHAQAGFERLRDNPFFADAAELVRYHHTSWDHGQGGECDRDPISLASHILALADEVERMIDRTVPILEQTESITEKIVSLSGQRFQPDCVEAFCHIGQPEAFWLDIVSD